MSEQAIISIITGIGGLGLGLINWRLTQLEKKVDIHNGYAEKFAESNTAIALIQKDIEVIKNKMEEHNGE